MLGGLRAATVATAERLMNAAKKLTDEQSTSRVSTTILHCGEPMVDEPRPWGQMLVIHARVHVPGHTGQLCNLH